MKNKQINKVTNFTPSDNYEKELEEFLNKGDYRRVEDLKETKKMFQNAVKLYKELQGTKRITLRVNKEDLIKVKAKAKTNGIPYQTLLNTLIRQYAQGHSRLEL